jgi:hypothetical protein
LNVIASEEVIQAGIARHLALDFKQPLRGLLVFGFEGLLFAGAGILQISWQFDQKPRFFAPSFGDCR